MKSKTIFLSLFLVLSFGIWSCSEDDSSEEIATTTSGCNSFLGDYEAVSTAAQAFSQNPTSENCEAMKTAWLNFFEAYHDCPYWEEGDYQSAIDGINDMDCSDF